MVMCPLCAGVPFVRTNGRFRMIRTPGRTRALVNEERNRMVSVKKRVGELLLLVPLLFTGGCRWASGPGDTVETPPRALVEKSFRPGGGSPNPSQQRQNAPAPTGSAGQTR